MCYYGVVFVLVFQTFSVKKYSQRNIYCIYHIIIFLLVIVYLSYVAYAHICGYFVVTVLTE